MLRLLPLVTGLLPVFAIHTSYALAIAAGRVPSCLPYIDGCTSISATGRYEPASYLFRAAMLPEAVFLFLYWLLAAAWLRALERAGGRPERASLHIPLMGGAASIALVLYVSFLGTQEPFYEFMRRFGIYGFFLFTILAQIGTAWRALPLVRPGGDVVLVRLVRAQLWLGLVPFLMGALNLLLKATLDDPDNEENVIEWIVVMLMQAYFVLGYFAWRRSGFHARYGASPSA